MPLFLNPLNWPAPLRAALVLALGAAAAAAWMVQSGAGARALRYLDRTLDVEVVLLFVPLCALVLAIVAEAVRLTSASGPPEQADRRRRLPRGWQPGHGEG